MYKDIHEIGPEFISTNNTKRRGKKIWIVTIILLVIGLVGLIVGGSVGLVLMDLGFSIGIPLILIAFVYSRVGSGVDKEKQELAAKIGVEGVLNEVHNEALCIVKDRYSGDILTIITPKRIYDLNYGIYSTDKISYVYDFTTKGHSRIKVYTLDEKNFFFGHGMEIHGQAEQDVYNALRSIKPDILVGYSAENKKEYFRRVKEYKENA